MSKWDKIPADLKHRMQWVLWRREGKEKVPYRTNGEHASPKNKKHWTTFEKAVAASGDYDGIGFVFTSDDPFVGIDLDDCVSEDGELSDFAVEQVELFDSYTEYSQSRTGVHIIVLGEVNGPGRNTEQFEIYDRGRFFVVTGDVVDGTSPEVLDRQEEVFVLYASTWVSEAATTVALHKSAAPSDTAVLREIQKSRNRDKFDRLWRGDWRAVSSFGRSRYPSQSEADAALCQILCFWLGPDPHRIDAFFRKSGLMRDKWDSCRGKSTYGEITIAKAILHQNLVARGNPYYDWDRWRSRITRHRTRLGVGTT